MTTDRELIRELLDEQEDLAASTRKAELRDRLLALHALLEPLTDGAVYTFNRLGGPVRRAPHAEVKRPTLHYAGVVSGGRHFLSGERFVGAPTGKGLSAREMAAHLLELSVIAERVIVLRADDGVATVLAEPATFQVGDRVRITGHHGDDWPGGTVVEVRLRTTLPYRVQRLGSERSLWFAPRQLTKLDG